MDRRTFIKNAALFVASAALLKNPPLSVAAPAVIIPRDIKIGIFAPSHCSAPLIYALYGGLYKEAGLNVKLINFPTLKDLAHELARGNLSMGQMAVPVGFSIRPGGGPNPYVMPMILGVHGSNLMVRKGLDIRGPGDLRGKRLATHTRLTVHYLLVNNFLERHGLNPEQDAKVLIVPAGEMGTALDRGEVDAFMLPEPANALAEHAGKARVYMSNKYIWRYHPCCGLFVPRAAFDKDRGLMKVLVSATAKGAIYVNKETNRHELVNLLRKTPFGYAGVPVDALTEAFSFERSAFQPFPYKSTAMVVLEMMERYKLMTTPHKRAFVDEVCLSKFMRECLASSGERAPASDFRPEIIFGHVKTFET